MAIPRPSSPVTIGRRSRSPSDGAIHSPVQSRSFDPHDPQVMERQLTMDVDMAMQLSFARRDTLATAPGPSPPQSSPFPPSEDNGHIFSEPDHNDALFKDTAIPQPPLQHSEPSLLTPHNNDDLQASNFGLPTYQANVSQSAFDFGMMEEFAAAEKTRLGLSSSPATRFSLPPLRGRPKPDILPRTDPELYALASGSGQPGQNADAQPGEPTAEVAEGTSSNRPLRHRKLSQSNSAPRTHRKGIGGKMAMFESNPNENPSSFSARLGLALNTSGVGLTAGGNSYEHISGVPGVSPAGGILLNTGHDRPYRFSFYSNALSATIHARSLSELPAEGQTFEQLFTGLQPTDASTSDPNKRSSTTSPPYQEAVGGRAAFSGRHSTDYGNNPHGNSTGSNPSNNFKRSINGQPEKVPNGGGGGAAPDVQDANTWWLDVQNPTDEEMKMLSKVFSIHPLTTEDILMEETREKIELFRNYYLVCFRSFDQDPYSPTHLEPLNMYIIVFREGTLSFHFRPTPHPQNVRRRIKQLRDYISVTSDWISYALIDDITDAFGPLIQGIEYEVDSIDELVLILKETEQSDMLRRIGTCRKKVMGLLRLMGNKADVVKGLAKRCNENWRVAPTSDIGLYLSDIQDHLITMTQNLNHYEKILSRSHSNYLAQISIEMTDANNQINHVLSKLTAMGTVLIPMNLVTGLWGMNVHVPGQDVPGYAWFLSIIACLTAFAIVGGYSTYRFMVRK